MKKRDVLSSPRIREIKRKKRKIFFFKLFLLLFFLLVVFTGFVFLSRWQYINVKDVEVTGIQDSDALIVKNAVEEQIFENYLLFFPKTNRFLIPKSKIIAELSDKYKRLKDISIKISNNFLSVSVSAREGAYLWCGDRFSPGTDDVCYFLDNTGYIFEEAPYFSGSVYFKFFGTIDNAGNEPLGKYFQSDVFEKLISFQKTLELVGVKAESLEILIGGDMAFYLRSTQIVDLPPKIIFNAGDDFVKLSENLQTALSTEPLLSDFRNKYENLEYIDLRFGNKVYYKFR